MITRLGNLLLVLALFTLLVGCKLTVVATSGGNVKSSSNTRDCVSGKVCAFDLTAGFSEEFLAVARPGFKFVRWQQGAGSDNGGFQCGNSTKPVCLVQLPSDDIGTAIAALTDIGYIMPVFCEDTDGDLACNSTDTDDDNDGVLDNLDNCPLLGPNGDGFGCPLTDTLTVNGRTWYQPDLFQGITRSQIEAVCPSAAAGACVAGGVLNGRAMTGWTWASISDYNGLVSNYPGTTNYVCVEMQLGGFRPYLAALPQGPGAQGGQGYVGNLRDIAPAPGPGYAPGPAAGLMVSWPYTPFCSNFVTTEDYIAHNPLGYTFIFSGWFS